MKNKTKKVLAFSQIRYFFSKGKSKSKFHKPKTKPSLLQSRKKKLTNFLSKQKTCNGLLVNIKSSKLRHLKILIGIKVEKILKDSLDLIPSPSPSVKIKIMGGKVCLRCKGKTLLGVVNICLETKSLMASPSNVLPYYLK